jgi:ATP-dependent Clp protease ATP-binding subunit ClpC
LKIPEEIVSSIVQIQNRLQFNNSSLELFSTFTDKALTVINSAYQETHLLGHNFIGSESILLGLIHENTGLAAYVLNNNGVTLETARFEVEKIVGRGSGVRREALFTPRAIRVLELSRESSVRMMNKQVNTEHLLLALLAEDESVAISVLNNLGVELSNLEDLILEIIAP